MLLKSRAFGDGQDIPERYGKSFENVSIPLAWADVPEGALSFALSMVDTHPIARGYVHWLVVDLPADVRTIETGSSPERMPSDSTELKPYAGPFPPSGTHDYELTLLALDTDHAELPHEATLAEVHAALDPHVLARATLTGSFTTHHVRPM